MKIRSKFIAEFIGTFALVFAGCGSVAVSATFPESIPNGAVPLVFGLVVAAMIYAVGHISGAHFNPAVTLAFAVARKFPKKEIPFYWAAQFIASVTACSVLWALVPDISSYGATVPVVSTTQAMGWELVLSFFLMFVIIAVATDTRAVGTMAGAAIGATVTLCAMFGGPMTGASMNPARSFGPNLFEGAMSVYWIYLIAPMVGTVLAAVVYEYIRCHEEEPESGTDAGGCC